MTMLARYLTGVAAMLLPAATASAAVVLDPVPTPIGSGLGVGLSRFVTAPASAPIGTMRSLVQGMRSLNDGSNRLFVNDTRGLISVTSTAGAAPAPWFDIRNQNVGFQQFGGQTGLLSFAFHPNFGRDRGKPGYASFYTVDTAAAGTGTPAYSGNGPVNHHNIVREWTVADPRAATATVTATREVLRVAQPRDDHGPGTISFNTSVDETSPDYGKLYIGLGDGGGPNDPFDNAQDARSPFGKILRIDPADPDGAGPATYSVPAGNAYTGGPNEPEGALREIWASGLRNPQNFSWDAATGTMYIADIGQAQLEEVNVGRAGANYGWPRREGTFGRYTDKGDSRVNDDPNPGFTDPIAQYDHDEGDAISGALIYRGTAIPELAGQAILSDLSTGRLFHLTLGDVSGVGGTAILRELRLSLDGVPTTMLALEGDRGRVDLRLGLDEAGEIYLLTKGDGTVYRLVSGAVPEPEGWALLLLGTAVTGVALRRRSRRGVVSPHVSTSST